MRPHLVVSSACRLITTDLPGCRELLGLADSDLVELIRLPEMTHIDRPAPKDLPVIEHRLRKALDSMTALDLLRFGTIKDVANYLHFGWDAIKGIHKSKLQSLYRKIPVHKIEYLGIDEFSLRQGHNYMTIFIDLQRGRIIHAVKGRSADVINPFLTIVG